MEILVISAMFFAIVLAGLGLAVALLVRAIRADQRDVNQVERGLPASAA